MEKEWYYILITIVSPLTLTLDESKSCSNFAILIKSSFSICNSSLHFKILLTKEFNECIILLSPIFVFWFLHLKIFCLTIRGKNVFYQYI